MRATPDGQGQARAPHPIIAESADESPAPVPVKAANAAPIANALSPRANSAAAPDLQRREQPSSQRSPLLPPGSESKRFGWNGIAILKGGGVVVTGKDGQREVPIGGKLPDGSVLKGVDAKASSILTDRGQFLLTE